MSEPVPLHSRRSALRPNWRLKAARERRGWSQQEMADRLSVTPNTVSRWERGISAPGPYFRRQLCDLLGKSAEELGLLAGKSAMGSELAAQSHRTARSSELPIWNVPFQRNPFFTGREKELLRLQERLQPGSRSTNVSQALCGLAGVGKTQTAVEYCYRFYEEYQAVLWVRADMRETLVADLTAIAALLELPERDEHDQQRVVEAVKNWLRVQRNWLLTLDNIEDLTLIQEILPPIHQGHILLTMRAQTSGTLAQSIDLRKMDTQEGALLLLRRTKYIPPEAEESEATPTMHARAVEIAQLLDGLPLALDQAAAYIEETACSLADYIDRYQSQRTTLLALRGAIGPDHPASVATTLSLVIERVETLNPAAANLLRLCSFLQPDAIPEAMITEGATGSGSILEPLARDPYTLDAAIKTLRDFSLIRRHAEDKTLTLHRLVQAVVQDRLEEQTRRQWAELTVALVSRTFSETSEFTNWSYSQQYLPQAQACTALIERWGIVTPEAGVLLLKTGNRLQEHGQYAQAEELLLRARPILLRTVGEIHSDYATYLNDLALLYHYWGRYEQAEPLYRQALYICEQIFGTEHLSIAEGLNNLGGLLYSRGQYAQAEEFFLRAMTLREKLLEPESPEMLLSLHNMGFIYLERGKYAQAEPFLRRTLALQEKLLGAEHPRTLSSLEHLARFYAVRRHYEQAESLYRKALELQEKLLGAEHSDVVVSLYNLGQMYLDQGQYEQAEPLYRRALVICERVLGPEHPRTARILNNLARLLIELGQQDQGEELCQRALSIQQRTPGTSHPDYADSLATLAILAEQRGEESRARQLYQQALSICEGTLAPEHLLVIRCQAAYTRLLAKVPDLPPTANFPPLMSARQSASETEAQTSPSATDEAAGLDDFLAACCDLHPRAWCRASDLWSAYQRWVELHRKRFPLSHRAFAQALKKQGFRPDRTNTYRTWRGIALRTDLSDGE